MAMPENPKDSVRFSQKRGPQQLQQVIDSCLEPTLRAKGFVSTAIHLHWTEIVGTSLAPWSEPILLKWPATPPGADTTQPKAGAVLTIKTEGAFALDIQHQAPQIIERVNSFFGWRCVERIAIKQGPVRKLVQTSRKKKRELSVAASQSLDRLLQPVEDSRLKAVLAKLGVGVLTRGRS